MRELSFTAALREALTEEMDRDRNVILLGEDIGVYGGAFGVTKGLLDQFGPERVRNTPVSEAGFVGAAIGASLLGLRPVVEIMFMDFILLALDQIANHGAKFPYVYGEQARVPLVIRAPGGGGSSYGPTHSQSLESIFLSIPGIKVVAPSNPADAKGLLKSAIRDDNLVLFLESKVLYPQQGPVPEQEFTIPFGKAVVRRSGGDVTVAAYSRMVGESLLAAEELSQDGIECEVIDLRTLNPLDLETIATSVRNTGRAVLVEEGTQSCGVAAEIGFRLFEQVHDYLDAPIRRVTAPDIPVPCGAALESAALPNAARIAETARSLVKD